ncbi:hypothetical protein L7F22_040287, partial [Adiantum nelumboides]|nr:hypothetical protein [Adiantum nelumboides]
ISCPVHKKPYNLVPKDIAFIFNLFLKCDGLDKGQEFDISISKEDANTNVNATTLLQLEKGEILEEEEIDVLAEKKKRANFDVAEFKAATIIDEPTESSFKKKREPQVLSTKSNESFDAMKGDLHTKVISKEFEGGATISARFDKEETNCNLEEIVVHDVKEIQMMDDDVLPIAHEILAKSKLVRDKVELSKNHNPSKPLTSIPVSKEKSPSKSPCIVEAFAAARNARKRKVILEGARGDQNDRLDAGNGSKSAKEKDFMVVAGDTSALKK